MPNFAYHVHSTNVHVQLQFWPDVSVVCVSPAPISAASPTFLWFLLRVLTDAWDACMPVYVCTQVANCTCTCTWITLVLKHAYTCTWTPHLSTYTCMCTCTLRLRAVSRVEERREHERISARSCFWKLSKRRARNSIMALRLTGSGRVLVRFSSSYTRCAMRASILQGKRKHTCKTTSGNTKRNIVSWAKYTLGEFPVTNSDTASMSMNTCEWGTCSLSLSWRQ